MKKIKTIQIIFLLSLVLLFSGCQNNSHQSSLYEKLTPMAVGEENGIVTGTSSEYNYANPWQQTQYDSFFKQAQTVPDVGDIKGAIVPHHLLAGYIPATLFSYLEKQKPSVIVLVGPNHFFKGQNFAISTLRDWKTPYGIVQTDKSIVTALAQKGVVDTDEAAIVGEHSLYGLIPFISKTLPRSKVVPIMLRYKTGTDKLDSLIKELEAVLPKDTVIIGSIDFSHYQTQSSSNFHDELTQGVIRNFDYPRFDELEIDSVPSLYVVSKMMDYYGSRKIAFEIKDNSQNILHEPDLAEGTSYYSPYFVKGEPQKEKIASILNFGDMMLDRNVRKAIDTNSKDYIFEKLAGQENRFFSGMDVVAANLEGPFANKRRPTSKSIAFRFDPDLLPMLKKYNFSLFSQANNHSYDMGADGFKESKNNLKTAGFDFYGAQYRVDDESLLVKKIGDFTFGFIGINDTNSPVDEDKVKSLITKARTQGADYVVMNIHWGEEYKEISNTRQRTLAHDFIDAGADVIIGHHPHVVEEMEVYKNHPIFYSLGNFVFDQYFSVPTQQGLALGLIFKEKQISAYVLPLQGVKSQVSQMKYDLAVPYMNNWEEKSRLGDYKFDGFNLKINL